MVIVRVRRWRVLVRLVRLNPGGRFKANAVSFPVCAPGVRASLAGNQRGSASYPSTRAGGQLLEVVDENLITPLLAANNPGANNTMTTHHINDNSSAGFKNAPDGTTINFSILSGPGSFVGGVYSSNSPGGTGSCTVQITSAVTGTTVVRARPKVKVRGVPPAPADREPKPGDSADANKDWVNARISITPSATNEVGHAHTFIVTLLKDTGAGFVAAAGETVTVTCTASNGATPTPAGPFTGTTNASGSVPGNGKFPNPWKETVSGGVNPNITGATTPFKPNAKNGNSGDAVKTWVDANIL